MTPRLWVLLVLAAPLGAGNLIENGGIGAGKGWRHTGGKASVTFAVERGSLRIANTDTEDTTPHNWYTRFSVPEGAPYRLKLTVRTKATGLDPDSKANVMVQLYPEKGNAIGYAWCDGAKNGDWREIKAVFEVPAECKYVRVLAYLVGKGRVWYDDFSVEKTDEAVTPPPQGGRRRVKDDRMWKLVRDAAREIPWEFDPERARKNAGARTPLLLYVRSVDDRDQLANAQTTLRADKIQSYDDGLRKDVLFRAGPLSDPDVTELIRRHFVPLLLTYHFGTHGNTGASLGPWLASGTGKAEIVDDDGAKENGALYARAWGGAASWTQRIDAPPDLPAKAKLAAAIRTRWFKAGAKAWVGVHCHAQGGAVLLYAATTDITGDKPWTRRHAGFVIPKGTTTIALTGVVSGKGDAWFDDLSLICAGKELVENGHVDPRAGVDPLKEFGLKATEIGTPALVVIRGDEKTVLHRIGTMSTDLVDHWLRTAAGIELQAGASSASRAKALIRQGDLDGAEKLLVGKKAPLLRGRIALRRGAWLDALEAFQRAGDEPEARFYEAWCFHRLGKRADAERFWREMAGPTLWGRRAAACVMPNGPRLWLSMSERAWPRGRALPEQTEGYAEGFDADQSLARLLELQNADGSFGSHHGAPGKGYWDGAITAIAAEALRRWGRTGDAYERALAYLVKWSGRGSTGQDAFNNPYVLLQLVRAGRKEAARRVVARIAASQQADGNWTVYHAKRPASFNTALAILALARARDAGLDVPEDTWDRSVAALEKMRRANDLFPYSTATGHEWMTTEHGSIARDALCEHALLAAGRGDRQKLENAFERFMKFGHELRVPTKRYYDYFNRRGHGGYYFFFAHRNAYEASAHASEEARRKVRSYIRDQVLKAREGDGTFMDHYMLGRAYATAQALCVLHRTEPDPDQRTSPPRSPEK